jgi:hypothetical protein
MSSRNENRPMTPEQTAQLRELAREAYEFEAYDPALTKAEAQLRIETLRAKLKLQGEPPHPQ